VLEKVGRWSQRSKGRWSGSSSGGESGGGTEEEDNRKHVQPKVQPAHVNMTQSVCLGRV
jgi:hypothetical protein